MTPSAELTPDAAPLEAWLSATLGASIRVVGAERLTGGAIQQNWLLRLEGAAPAEVVLRRDASARISESHGRAAEFALLRAAEAAGVSVPRPIALCEDASVLGGPFIVTARLAGVAFGPRVVRDTSLCPDRDALAAQLGRELARLHRIVPPRQDLPFLGHPPSEPALSEVARIRGTLDNLGAARPGLEWCLRWAERHAPTPRRVVLTHRDFRTGNFMIDASGLTGILDWEFAGWGDPFADLGWFCAACWRFGRLDFEAGGIASRASLYRGYEAESGEPIDDEAVHYWEVLAHLRWAGIALAQGWRHASQDEPSVELALTGRLAAELELAALRATAPERWSGGRCQAAEPVAPQPVTPKPAAQRDLHPETMGSALLDAAQRTLEIEVLPGLSGPARYAALMVGSAVRMAAREIAQQQRLVTSEADVVSSVAGGAASRGSDLVEALRAGAFDGSTRLHAALWSDAAVRTSLSKPSFLTRSERRLAGLPDEGMGG